MGKERHWSTDDLQYACVKKLEVFSLDQEKLVSEQEQWKWMNGVTEGKERLNMGQIPQNKKMTYFIFVSQG